MRLTRLKAVASTAILVGVSFAGISVGAPAAPAHSGGPPAGCRTLDAFGTDGYYGSTCFEWSGDDQWVWDALGNDWSTRVEIETDYGKIRWCANTHGAGFWHECKFDHAETWPSGTPHCVRFQLFEQDGGTRLTRNWTGWSSWVEITTGNDCFF